MKKLIGLLIAVVTVLSLVLSVSGATTGITITGQVTSNNPNNETVIELYKNGTAVYSGVIRAADGTDAVTQY